MKLYGIDIISMTDMIGAVAYLLDRLDLRTFCQIKIRSIPETKFATSPVPASK